MKGFKKSVLVIVLLCIAPAVLAQRNVDGPRADVDRRGSVMADLENRIPTVPVILDGVRYEPGTVRETSGLIFVLTEDDQKAGSIRAFSNKEAAGRFMAERQLARQRAREGADPKVRSNHHTTDPGGGPCQHPEFGQVSLFNKVRGGGGSDNLIMFKNYNYPGEYYTNLDFDGWNNTISYVEAACAGYWTAIYSCRYFDLTADGGCESPGVLFVEEGLLVPDLYPYGWNNRASSLRFCRYDFDESYDPYSPYQCFDP